MNLQGTSPMKQVITLCFLLASLGLSHSALSAKVYTWTDAKGVTHYGERPPADTKAKIINARTGYSEPVPSPEAIKTQAQAEQTAETLVQQNPERCAAAKKNLDALNNYASIKVKNEKGEMRFLSEEEKATKLAEMQEIANESCEPN
jgi:hypothetical protein